MKGGAIAWPKRKRRIPKKAKKRKKGFGAKFLNFLMMGGFIIVLIVIVAIVVLVEMLVKK
jgi:hypothetical protein